MNDLPKKPGVMVVEDERIVAFNLQQRLVKLGYRVTGIASSGEEALEKIQLTAPDLVLMDIRLDGELDGIETAARLALHSAIPVIYLTAHAEQSTMDRARATRPYGYLLKPFSELSLHATVQMALERRSVDIKLQESEERYRRALDEMLEGCVIIGFDWRYEYANESALRQARRMRDEIIGHTILAVYPEIEKTELFAAMKSCMESRLAQRLQYRFDNSDGNFSWFDVSMQPVPAGVFVFSIDNTSQKLAEEKLQKLNEELETRVAQRTAALDAVNKELEAFSFSVSHDLRAPLRHLDGFARLAVESIDSGDGGTKKYLDKIIVASSKMGTLIDDLLALSRAGSAELNARSVDLQALVYGVSEECMAHASGRNIEWRIHTLPRVLGDSVLLRQVLTNLIANAIKFTRNCEHAAIDVSAKTNADNDVEICVHDNGAGFDPNYAGKLFGVFQRLHSERDFEGTGIGLAIVRRVVERHGGKTWATSELGKGADFYLTLKAATSSSLQ